MVPTSNDHSFELKVFGGGALSLNESFQEDGGLVDQTTDLGTPIAGQWALVELSWDFNAGTMRVSLNGASQTASIAPTPGVTSIGVNLGETGDSDSEHFQARIDDFASRCRDRARVGWSSRNVADQASSFRVTSGCASFARSTTVRFAMRILPWR